MKRMKEKEFLELNQGNKSVSEYEIEFSWLARFAPEFVRTDSSRARRFESGFRQPLKRRVWKHLNLTHSEKKGKNWDSQLRKPKYGNMSYQGKFRKEDNGEQYRTESSRAQPRNCPICRRNHHPNTVGVGVMSVVKQGMSVQNFSQLIKKWGKEIKRPCLCLHLHNPCTCQDLLKPITTLH